MSEQSRSRLRRLKSFGAACAVGALGVLIQTQGIAQQAGGEQPAPAAPAVKSPLPSWAQFVEEILTFDLFSIALWRLVLAFVVILLGMFMRKKLLERLLKPFLVLASKTKTDMDEQLILAIQKPLGWVVNISAVYLGLLILKLPQGLSSGSMLVIQTVGTILLSWMLFNAVEVLSQALDRFTQATESDLDDHLVPLVRKLMRIVIVVVAILMIVQLWGYDVTSLLAGLGLGGLAFALAAQKTLTNLFGSIMIFTDRPFKLGDWILSKHGEGVVEEIGLRSTKIRTFANTLITVPNADVADVPIENFSVMTKRRIRATIGLVYTTKPEVVDKIVERIREHLGQNEAIDQGFWAVNFVEFSASSLDIMVYCFTKTTDWKQFMNERQALYLTIMRIVQEEGSSFAFPSQSLYMETPIRIEREA